MHGNPKSHMLFCKMRRNLIEARENAGLTQSQLAAKVHVSQSTIARIESAENMPAADLGLRLEAALGVALEQLLVVETPNASVSP